MNNHHQQFSNNAHKTAFDEQKLSVRQKQAELYEQALENGLQQFSRTDLARQRAAKIKRTVLNDLEKYLKDFEGNFQKNGGEIIWATNADEAIKAIADLVQKHAVKRAVKADSIVAEEVGLATHLRKMGVDTLETALHTYLQQLAGEPIVSVDLSTLSEEGRKQLCEKLNVPVESDYTTVIHTARKKLRMHFFNADMGITGVNFLLANQGAIALSDNEGNCMLNSSFPKIHVAVSGIEKIIPDAADLDLFWPLLASYSNGQKTAVYNSIISGPKHNTESDGPEKLYLILIDNGRTNVLNTTHQREALSCIQCGACSSVCPVFKTVGEQSYQTTYTGPIGSVLTPLMKGMADYDHLSHACTMCGKCTEVCPVEIPLHELLLYNRHDAVKEGTGNEQLSRLMKSYKRAMKSRKMLDLPGSGIKRLILHSKIKRNWGDQRELPRPARKSFHQLWKESNS